MNVKKLPLKRGDETIRTSGAWAKSNERVLVISDSDEMRARLTDILSSEGFVVFDQPSAIGATRSIRQNSIRAVIVDVGLPGVRGEKLVSLMRENPRLDGLVLVVVVPGKTDDPSADAKGLQAVDAILEQASLEYRLVPLLGRLLRSSSFHPQQAFSITSGNKM